MNLDPNNLEPRDVMLLNSINKIGTMLGCVANAVSKLAPQPASDWQNSDFVEIDPDPRVYAEMQRTDWITTTLADGNMRGTVTTWHDDNSTGLYISSDGDLEVKNPTELHALAERLRTVYADALDVIASQWDERRDTGEIPTKETE